MSTGLPATGELLDGKYRIERVIGEGAWGEVLEGLNVRIQRRVAIKVLKAQYASNAVMVQRFEREALASTHIESPHVVQILDAGVLGDGRPYMVMEFLVGEDLGKRIEQAKGKRLAIVEALGFCIQIARGLAAAHGAGIFHRDMKPSNIVIAKTKSGREVAKIVDFGIAKLLEAGESTSNTQTGTIMGSPVYMSPEQARGAKTTDHRSDIYSLGVVLYESITGRTPFVADSFNELLFKIALEDAPTAQSLREEIDDDLNAIIMKATSRAPESRYQHASELEAAMIGWLQKNGGMTGDWSHDTGGPGESLSTSPTRPRSLPEILVSSAPEGGTPTAPQTSTATNRPPDIGKETGTSLSKTADPTEVQPPRVSASKKNTIVYAVGGAALLLIGVIAISTMKKGPTPDVKPDPKAATSLPAATDPAVSAKPSAMPPPIDSAPTPTTDAKDSGAAATTSASAVPVPVPVPATAKQPSTAHPTTRPATPGAASTSVGGRTIRTDF